MMQRLKRAYLERVFPIFCIKFQYQNIHQIPYIKKIVINQRFGIIQNFIPTDLAVSELENITTQRGVITPTHMPLAGFKIRKDIKVRIKVTLRGNRIYAFIDRLLNLALPRKHDFQGLRKKNFDRYGNYNFGLIEQLLFPEIRYEEISQLCGMNLSIITSVFIYEERFIFFFSMGIPFKNSY